MIVFWQDIVKELKPRSGLVLMYLALGEDYPYNMVQNFKNGLIPKNGWNENKVYGFKSLTIKSEMYKLLNNMEKRGLLISRQEKEGLQIHFYRLNPMILCDFSSASGLFLTPFSEIINIELFLERLAKKVHNPRNNKQEPSKKELRDYFKLWSSFETFDYIAFIQLLELEAENLGLSDMKDMLRKIRYQYGNFDTVSREIDFQMQINKTTKGN